LNLNFLAEFLVNMSASADVLAMAKVEVDLAAIPEGKNVSSQTIGNMSLENWTRQPALQLLTFGFASLGYHQVARQACFHSTQD
jgi:hypothetical protein